MTGTQTPAQAQDAGEPIVVGQFTLDGGTLTGPAAYMTEQGNAKLNAILAGRDAAFNVSAGFSPSIEIAILVALQTDYAGWKGMRAFNAMRGVK